MRSGKRYLDLLALRDLLHDSERFYVDPATIAPRQQPVMRDNMATMRALAGDPYMRDPELRAKPAGVTLPTLVLWRDSDRTATPASGETYAGAFGNARFEVIGGAGHLPQIERPAATLAAIDRFIAR